MHAFGEFYSFNFKSVLCQQQLITERKMYVQFRGDVADGSYKLVKFLSIWSLLFFVFS
jgi:hypothetical protein